MYQNFAGERFAFSHNYVG